MFNWHDEYHSDEYELSLTPNWANNFKINLINYYFKTLIFCKVNLLDYLINSYNNDIQNPIVPQIDPIVQNPQSSMINILEQKETSYLLDWWKFWEKHRAVLP